MVKNRPYSIKIRGSLYELSEPKIMGILNINADSFFDGGAYQETEQALKQAKKMWDEGADIIDIGPASSKPGSAMIDPQKEWEIVKPVLEAIRSTYPEMRLSLDSYNAFTAEKAISNGVDIINDITAGTHDSSMLDLIGETKVPYIMMHMQGRPENMQNAPRYDNVLKDIALFFSERLAAFREAGATDLILDPGFGFGKTIAHNYRILAQLHYFQQIFELPMLIGLSRKSMIYKLLNSSAAEALNGTTALNMLALQQGASFLRVHDVKEAVEVKKLYLALKQNGEAHSAQS